MLCFRLLVSSHIGECVRLQLRMIMEVKSIMYPIESTLKIYLILYVSNLDLLLQLMLLPAWQGNAFRGLKCRAWCRPEASLVMRS